MVESEWPPQQGHPLTQPRSDNQTEASGGDPLGNQPYIPPHKFKERARGGTGGGGKASGRATDRGGQGMGRGGKREVVVVRVLRRGELKKPFASVYYITEYSIKITSSRFQDNRLGWSGG